jgi:urea transport system substrate-binding protein
MKPTPTDTHCPPLAELRRLLEAGLADAEAARLQEHLRLCASCRQRWRTMQTETVASPTPPLLHAVGDTNPGQAAPPASDSVLAWSSQVSLEGDGGVRAPAPSPLPSDAPRSFAFLSPARGEGELGWLAHYRVTGLLGEGGMGFVFDAFDTHLHRRVALKVLKPELAANHSFRERFLQEARAAAALPDEHIITIYQVGLENDVPFLAMKFLHGESLEQRLQRDGRIAVPEMLRMGREIALGLSAAHDRGLIHRDIKPANLWLETPPPDEGSASGPRLSCEYVYRVKLLDFGLARPIHDARRLTATGLIVGTPAYLAPEQARGQALDHRCDLFSLGIVLYRMVTGILPFDGSDTLAQLTALAVDDPRPLEQLAPETPAGLRILIHKLLARDPAQRPPSARAVAEALRALEKGETLPAPVVEGGEGRGARKKDLPPRKRWLWAGGFAVLLLVGGLLAWKGFRSGETDNVVGTPEIEPIKVGVLFSLRGPMSNGGSAAHDAVLLAVDELNRQGGLLGRKIVAVDGDGESDYRKFAKVAQKLIAEDGVSAIFGCRASSNRKAVLPIVEEYKNLLFYPMQFEGLEESPNIIYLGAAPNQQILPALDYMIGIQRKRRLFLLGSDYVFPRTANEIIRDYIRLRQPDAQIVGEAYIPFGGSDVHEAIRSITKKAPDLIVNTINGDSNSAFFRSLQQAGLSAERMPVLSFSMGENDLLSMGEVGKGHYAAWSYFQSIDRPENREFIHQFRARFGARRVLSDPMEAMYFGVFLWAQAVQAAGTVEPSAVIQAIKGRSFEAPEGRVRIDRDTRYTWRVLRIGRVGEDGQFEILSNSERPQKPEPFPASRSRGEWERFLKNLYAGWGERWQAPTR